MLEDLYCSSYVLGFKSITGKVLDLKALIKDNPRNRTGALSEFFFLKCEVQVAWAEWYNHRSLVDYASCQHGLSASRNEGLAITQVMSPSEENACWFGSRPQNH